MVPLWALLGVSVALQPAVPWLCVTDVQPCSGGLPVRTDIPIGHWSKEPVEGVQGRPVEAEAPAEEDLVTVHSGRLLPE